MNSPHGTILLVDDDPNDVFLLQRAFDKARLTHTIQAVSDGEQAVDYLAGRGRFADRERHPVPVLVLLDLKVPRVSGAEVLEWLRQQPMLKRLPVVVMTSAAEAGEINAAYDRGANSYLVKPLGFERLLELVKAMAHYWLVLNEPADLAPRVPSRDQDPALTN